MGTYLPLLIGTAVDELQAKFDFQRVVFYALLLIGLASLMWLIRMASRLWIFGAGRLVEFDLKQRLFEHLLRLEPSYFAENTPEISLAVPPVMWIIFAVWWVLAF